MAENIERDFTTAQLEYLYELLDERIPIASIFLSESESKKYNDVLDTYYAGIEGVNSYEQCYGGIEELFTKNGDAARNLISIWNTIGDIDARYQTLFSAHRECMKEYRIVVENIAEMINIDNVKDGWLGQGDSKEAIANIKGITANFNKASENLKLKSINDALDFMGITDPEERQSIIDFTKNNNYSTQQAVSLVLAAKTAVDREQLQRLINKQYGEIAKIDPFTMSPEMLQAISDYAALLAVTATDENKNWEEITDFFNGFSSGEPWGPDPNSYYKKYTSEYFMFFQEGISSSYSALSLAVASGIANSDGDYYVWKEPKDDYMALKDSLDNLTSLSSLFGFGAAYPLKAQSIIDQDREGQVFVTYGGFTISDLTINKPYTTNFNISNQVLVVKGTDPFSGETLYDLVDYVPKDSSFKLEPTKDAATIALGLTNEEIKSLQEQMDGIVDKYALSTVISGIGLFASFVPASSVAKPFVDGYLKAVDVYKKGVVDGKSPTEIAEAMNKFLPSSDVKGVYSSGFSVLNNLLGIAEEYKDLKDNEQKQVDNIYAMWFGMGNNGFYGGGSMFYLSDIVYYNQMYAQTLLNQNGVSSLVGYMGQNNDGVTITQDIAIGLHEGSALYNYLDKLRYDDEYLNTPADMIAVANRAMNDVEKLVWFGADRTGEYAGIVLDDPQTSLTNLQSVDDILKFDTACTNIGSEIKDAYTEMQGSDFQSTIDDYNVLGAYKEIASKQ